MEINLIKTQEQLQLALERLTKIFEAEPNTPEREEADILALLIHKFQNEQEPIKALNAEEAMKKDLLAIEEFKSNEDNIKQAKLLASQIKETISKNWFTLDKVCKKFQIKTQEAQQKIMALHMFKLCASKEEKGVIQFKIDLNQDIQKELIELEIQALENKVVFLNAKLQEFN